MSVASTITTAEQLAAARSLGRCELVRGELIMMSPAGWHHGVIASRIGALLRDFVQNHELGEVAAAETGFLIERNPDTVRAPDVGFVRRDRLINAPQRGYFPGAPDLAVEVLSPDDSAADTNAKVQEWLHAGTTQVWVVDPKHCTVTVYERNMPWRSVAADQELTGGTLLPGFGMRISDLFE